MSDDRDTLPEGVDPALLAVAALDRKLDLVLEKQDRILDVLRAVAADQAEFHEFKRRLEESCVKLRPNGETCQ